MSLVKLSQIELQSTVRSGARPRPHPGEWGYDEIRRGSFRGRHGVEFWHLGSPKQSEIVPMGVEEVDESPEVQRLDSSIRAPILKCVPRLRSAKDERGAASILEVIRIPRKSERSFDGSLSGVGDGTVGRWCKLCSTVKQKDNE